ncbi:MAG: hypothetical protein GY749_44695 [Desulfobacteraceae bacterium]|nr:hypothetical protein [Desulfobacteraceae bacterium]
MKINSSNILTLLALCLILPGLHPTPSYSQFQKGKIAFSANINSNWDIFVMDDNGNNIRQLTHTPFDERSPAISPDKKQIVYASSDGSLGIMNIDGKENHPLDLPKGTYNYPAWFPNGKRLILSSFIFIGPDTEDSDLWIYDMEDKTTDKALKQTGSQVYPACSGRSTELVYSLLISGPHRQISHQLWKYNPQTQKARQLLIGHFNDMHPALSPNENHIAFVSDRSGNYDLWLTDSDGNDLRQLTRDQTADINPVFSPDNSRILFVSNRTGIYELWQIDIQTRKTEKLSPFKEKKIEIRDPSWK